MASDRIPDFGTNRDQVLGVARTMTDLKGEDDIEPQRVV